MKIKRTTIVMGLLIMILLITGSLVYAAEIQFGGELNTGVNLIFLEDNTRENWQSRLELSFTLPEENGTSARFDLLAGYYKDGLNPEGSVNLAVAKLYLKQEFPGWNLTVGRQPISWNFGSLINTTGFAQGIGMLNINFSQVTSTGIDAVTAFIPLGWASGIDLAATFPNEREGIRYGIRGRTLWNGYELQASFIHQEDELAPLKYIYDGEDKVNLAAKGDLGPLGVYGSASIFLQDKQESPVVTLLGLNYTHTLNYYQTLSLQLEYLHDEAGVIMPIFSGKDLLVGLVSYGIDEFSSLDLALAHNPADGSFLVAPGYVNQITSDLELSVGAMFYLGEEGAAFGPGPGMIGPVLSINLNYPF
ncbi:MAG: hypothetical protein UMV23_06575 [Halanaerobium sp.]|nr:hypothetical protein [Halanaerobium sp.]